MKSMALGLLVGFLAAQAVAADGTWLTDLAKGAGQSQGGEENGAGRFHRLGLVPAVQSAAQECFVVTGVPELCQEEPGAGGNRLSRAKQQSDELKKANKELAKKHKIEGFPTVIVFDSERQRTLKDVGYDGKGKAADFIAKLKGLKKA